MGTIKAYLIAIVGAVVLVVLCIGVGWATWSYRSHLADKEVAQVRDDYEKLLMKQQQLTDQYRSLSDEGLAKIMSAIGGIKVIHTTVNNTIEADRKANPDFYNQPLPVGGREAWLKARTVMQ